MIMMLIVQLPLFGRSEEWLLSDSYLLDPV